MVVAVVDENAAVLFDGARARRLRVREDDEELELGDADGSEGVEGFEGDASYASASRLAGAAAVTKALEAFAPGTPRRLVAHHDGPSHSHFRDAFVTAAAARGVPSVDVVDVEREPSSVTGRVLRWDKEHGVDAPARGNTWALSETRAVAVTAGDASAARRETRNASKESSAFLARPLFLRRVAGATDALKIAREVVALAETRVDGFGGAHAMPVTLRGGGWQTRVLMV